MSEGWWGFSFEGVPGVFRWRCPGCGARAEGPALPEHEHRFCADCAPVPAPRESETVLTEEPKKPWTDLDQARMWLRRARIADEANDIMGALNGAANASHFYEAWLERKETA